MNFTIQVIGWFGALIVLLAYALVSSRRVEGDSPSYQFLNVAGALFLLSNTAYQGAYPSSFVNAVWMGIAIVALYRRASEPSSVGP